MYGLASHVTEQVAGRSWEELMMSKLFAPLGMNQSALMHELNVSDTADADDLDLAVPYRYDAGGDWRAESFKFHRCLSIVL